MVHYQNIMVTCTIFLILSRIIQISSSNGAYLRNFNVLLNLYKMNPLKDSSVYKTFSRDIYLSRVADRNYSDHLQLESNEKEREKTRINLKQIEQIIHSSKSETNHAIKNPDYDVNNVDTEKFDSEIFNVPFTTTSTTARDKDNFNALFEHLESDESDKISTTERDSNRKIMGSPILNNTKSFSTRNSFATKIKSLESIEFDKLVEDSKKRKNNMVFKTLINRNTDRFAEVVVLR